MAIKKMRMNQRNSSNGYDTLYPETVGEQVLMGDGSRNLEEKIEELEQADATHLAEKGTLTKAGHVQLNSSTNSTSETTAATPKAVKAAMDRAAAAETSEETLAKIEQTSFKTIKSGKDAEGVFITVEQRRKSDNTLARKSVLSSGVSPQYTTRTVTYYGTDGATVIKTDTFTLSYDTDGVLISEV